MVATRLPSIVELSGVGEGEDLGLEDHVGEAVSGEEKNIFQWMLCPRVYFELLLRLMTWSVGVECILGI